MSWKPSRSSGIMFDKFTKQAEKHRAAYLQMIQSHEYLRFENLNRFSKHLYLYWLNENKASRALTNGSSLLYSLEQCTHGANAIIPMLKRNIDKVYKPLRKHLN